jgi:SpoU rRNA methylase family enzyme
LKCDHQWKADNDTDSEEEEPEQNDPIGDLLESEGKFASGHYVDEEKEVDPEEEIEKKICTEFSSLDKNPWLDKDTSESTYFIITNNSEKSYMPGE